MRGNKDEAVHVLEEFLEITVKSAATCCGASGCRQVVRERLFELHNRTDLWFGMVLKKNPYPYPM